MESELTLQQLHQKAIKAALKGEWDIAVKINKKIISQDPENVDALNRLGTANINMGNENEGAKYFRKAYKLDPLNSIAKKNLKILRSKRLKREKITPAKYDLKGTIKEPDKNTRQRIKPYIRHTDIEKDN